jgi:hypothetical protein
MVWLLEIGKVKKKGEKKPPGCEAGGLSGVGNYETKLLASHPLGLRTKNKR